MKRVLVSLPDDVFDELSRRQEEYGAPLSTQVRRLVEKGLAQHDVHGVAPQAPIPIAGEEIEEIEAEQSQPPTKGEQPVVDESTLPKCACGAPVRIE